MARTKRLATAFATVAITVPLLSTGPAGAAVTAPAEDAVWYTGQAKTITWEALDPTTGKIALTLLDASDDPVDADPVTAGTQDIATGLDATATSHAWTIPAGIAGTGLKVQVHGDGSGSAWSGTAVVSDAFDIVATGAANVTPTGTGTDFAITGKLTIGWDDNGTTGSTVNIDLVRTVSSTTTTTSIAKNLAKADLCENGECEYEWTIPAKTGVDTDTATYKVKVTPATGASATSAAAFKIIDRSFTVTQWEAAKSVKAGEPVEIAWTTKGDLGTLKIVATPVTTPATTTTAAPTTTAAATTTTEAGNGVQPSAAAAKPIVIEKAYDADEGSYTWYPTFAQTGKYTIALTSNQKNSSKVAFSGDPGEEVTITAATEFNLSSTITGVADGTATLGAPLTISWDFGEAEDDPIAALPVDINLVDSNSKVTKIAAAVKGDFDDDGPLRKYTFRTPGKLAAGNYTVKVTVTGSTDAAFTKSSAAIALSAPGSLTLTTPEANDDIERGQSVDVEWTIAGDSELPVNINILNTTTNKATTLAKAVIGTEGDGEGKKSVTIPAKTFAAGTNYKIQVVSVDIPTLKAEAAIEIVTPTLAITNPAGTDANKDTLTKGAEATITWTLGDKSNSPVKIDVVKAADKADAKAKAVAVVSKAAVTTAGDGSIKWTPSTKLTSGDYVLRVTPTEMTTTATNSDEFAIVSAAVDEVAVSASPKAGSNATITWTLASDATDLVKIELYEGANLVAKFGTVSKSTATTAGEGSFTWKVPAAIATGDTHDYTIKVTSLSDSTKSDTSAEFNIAAAS